MVDELLRSELELPAGVGPVSAQRGGGGFVSFHCREIPFPPHPSVNKITPSIRSCRFQARKSNLLREKIPTNDEEGKNGVCLVALD